MHSPSEQNDFIAGTASPRRLRLLDALGIRYVVLSSDVTEMHDVADPVRTVVENATAKHAACASLRPEGWILTADTVVEFEGRCLGKPSSPDDARRMLIACAGKVQTVFTAVALSRPCHAPELRVVASSVHFKPYGAEVVDAYLERVRPFDRAGAYDIDTHGDMLISSYTGSYSNIMGLPVRTVADWLQVNGYTFTKKN